MTLEARKYNLINWITNLNDLDTIECLEALQNYPSETWEDLPLTVRNGIVKSLEQADTGELTGSEEVFEKYGKS